ncbi:fibronectin type III domain-containing protein [Chloroflexota bacterium]
MKGRKWLIILLAIVTVMSLATYTGVTESFFTDDEKSTDDALGIRWGLFTLNEDFEDAVDWDANWDENGTTTWIQDTGQAYGGSTYSAYSGGTNFGYITSDEIEASTADNITVSFQYFPKGLESNDVWLQSYNGTDYVNRYDIEGGGNNVWNLYSEVITDPQYLIAGFRIRFDSSLASGNDQVYIDDVVITTDTIPPAPPTGLVATGGGEQISLDWASNNETDLWGYNIYRGTGTGNYTEQVNSSPVFNSEYTDTPLYGGGTYYYAVKAVDYGNNESGYSNEAWDTANNIAPAAPTSVNATAGDEEISLDWNDNIETDLWGYNVYRSPTSGGTYGKINGSLVSTSNYTDTPLYGGGEYFYKVTAVDNVSAESGYSGIASATANNTAPAAPTSVNATAGNEQITLDWADNIETDLDGYNVHSSQSDGGPYSQINGSLVTSSNYTDTPLYGGGTYYYVVTAVDNESNESGDSNQASATANDIAPLVPTGLAATGGDEEISLDWNDNTEGDLWGYYIYSSNNTGGPYNYVDNVTAPTNIYIDTGLYGGGTYYYVVTAVDSGSNESGDSDEDDATANNIAPAAPTSVNATAGDELISLDWADNIETDLTGYNVYRGTTTGNCTDKIGSLVATSNYTDTGLYGGGTYYYVVTAVDNATAESGNSNEDSATANDVAPAAPAGLVATPGDKQVSLDWDDNNESDLAGYDIYRGLSTGNYTEQIESLWTSSNYTDTGLTGGVTYYYAVKAVDSGSNESGYSDEANATPTDPPPAAPTGLVATPGDKQVSLDWNDNSEGDLDGYDIYRGLSTGNYTQIESLWASSNYTDTGLTGGITYYYAVKAVDLASYESGYSDEATATPTDQPPAAPAGLTATPGDGLVNLDWDDNTEGDLDGYDIYRGLSTGNYTQIESLWASSNYTDVGLTGGITYYYAVKAVDLASYESSYSNEASAAPVDNPPVAPTGLVATRGNQKVYLNWNDNTDGDLDGYNVYRSESDGGPYGSKINGSLVTDSDYLDTGRTGGVTYYYVVTAVDLGSNESGNSNQASATPWAPWLWTQTSQAEFEAGVSDNVNTTLSSGNVILSAGGDAGGANMILLWDGGTAPTGWSIVSDVGGDFYQRFPRGEATYGSSGGTATSNHTATFSLTSAGSGSVAISSGANAGAATDTHTHTLASSTISTDPNLPVYRNLQVIEYNSGVPATIPAGAIAIFDTTLPAGWTSYSAQDNYFVQGEATASGTGGSANHTHTVSIDTDTPTGTATLKTPGSFTYAIDTHTHSETDSTDVVSNEPPYVTVILAKADSDTAIPVDMIAMFDASPTGNWNVLSDSGGDFYQKFLLGSGTYGSTGGSSSHSHINQVVTLATVTGTASNGKNTQSLYASATHTHTVDVTSFSADSSLPPYVNVVFAKAQYYPSGTIASQVFDTAYDTSEWPELAWDETLPSGTDITFEVRASDTAFLKTDATPSWTSVGSSSPVTTGLPSGRYKQWRVTLTPNGSGTLTPTLQEVRVYYQGD